MAAHNEVTRRRRKSMVSETEEGTFEDISNVVSDLISTDYSRIPDVKPVLIPPRPKLLNSLRHNTLSNEEAVADLLDNPFDWDVNAENVWMYKSSERFIMADDGSGMMKETLIEALKLGSDGPNESLTSDLGFYGIGLKNASMSLGRMLKVITKNNDDNFWSAIYDIDEIVKRNEFSIPIYPSTNREIETFNLLTHNSHSGTVLIIEKLDNIQKSNDADFAISVIKHIGETHRIFLHNGKKVFVNNKLIKPRYPFEAPYTSEKPEIIDQYYEFKKPDGVLFQVRIRLAFLPSITKAEAKKYGINLDNQGFYVLRNDRQLMRADWLKVATRHNDFNRLRGEIYFTGDLDDVFKINFEKNKIQIHQWFRDQLDEKVGTIIYGYKQRVVNERNRGLVEDEQVKEDFNRVAEEINSKANRISPLKQSESKKPRVIAASSTIENSTREEKNKLTDNPTDGVRRKRELVEFTTDRLELSYICYFEDIGNGALRIRWNVDHPFYPYVIEQSPETKSVFSKLLFALGRSFITLSKTPDYEKLVLDFQKEIGDELRKLME